jgi:hypothetical protein
MHVDRRLAQRSPQTLSTQIIVVRKPEACHSDKTEQQYLVHSHDVRLSERSAGQAASRNPRILR